MKRILFVGWYPNPIDLYRNVFFQNLIFAIADEGIECSVISPVSITKYRRNIKKIPKYTTHVTKKGSVINVYYPRYISASSKQIGRFNTERISERLFEKAALNSARKLGVEFDCVYGHFFLFGGLAATKIGRELKIPAFIAYGECDFESQVRKTYGIPNSNELTGLHGIISVSTKNTVEIKNLGFLNTNIPFLTYPNSVDLNLFCKLNKKDCRKELNFPLDAFIVGFIGGFIERKGDKRVLEAINRIDGVFGAFAGTGENPPSGEKVIFCSSLKHDLIPIFLNAIDVFCLPTLSEGSCNAVAEAMACGTPVISSNLPFNDDILNDSNSIRINPLSIDEIERSIRVCMNKDKLKSLSANSKIVTSQLDIKERAKAIIHFLGEHIND